MIALWTLTIPRLRMFALATVTAATLGLTAAGPASATTNDPLPTRKQVCYLDPANGNVCQWVWEWPRVILPQTK
jgi:hypothetical protein